MNKLESSAIRYFVSIVLVALGLYFGYEVITISNASSSHVSGGVAVKPMVLANGTVMVTGGRKTVCSGKHSHTKIVTIYEGDHRLEMKMYTFTQDDLSAEVLAHAAKKGRMAGSGFHRFYASQLCGPSPKAATPATAAATPGAAAATPGVAAAKGATTATAAAAPTAVVANATAKAAGATAGGRRALGAADSGFSNCKGVVLDIGAFIGTQALVLAKMGFEVHAFEPQLAAADLLRCSILSNKLAKNLHITAEGISDSIGTECLIYPMAKLTHQTMLAPKALSKNGCEPNSKVPVVTLDHYWVDVLQKRPIEMIKMDAEGHEEYILAGGKQLFEEAPPPFILMHYDPKQLTFKGSTAESFLKAVQGAGYQIYDCQAKMELKFNSDGAKVLKAYQQNAGQAPLLLVHKTKLPNGKMGSYACDG